MKREPKIKPTLMYGLIDKHGQPIGVETPRMKHMLEHSLPYHEGATIQRVLVTEPPERKNKIARGLQEAIAYAKGDESKGRVLRRKRR